MKIEIHAKYMHTKFGGRGFLGFGDIPTFQIRQNSLSNYEL